MKKELRPAIAVLIPNFNGQSLLAQHIPAVLKMLRDGDELCVVDDASTDESWQWLLEKFAFSALPLQRKKDSRGDFQVVSKDLKLSGKSILVTLIRNLQNLRFAKSCNRGVEQLHREFVLLLNSDVSPRSNVADRLVHHFVDPNVFGVGCLEEEGKQRGGRNEIRFQHGLFQHRRAAEMKSGITAWVSGGSGMFRVAMWQKLEGFDEDYSPAYWEDVDLSFRARRAGWRVLFDEIAVVEHHHESTNSDVFGQKKMAAMSWRHGLHFTWKNGTWWQRLQFLLWQPFWWLREVTPSWLGVMGVAIVMVVALFTRTTHLANNPPGFAWDEAAIGYNGYAIWNTRRDEWLVRLPLSFRSFGDYKAPLAIYLNGAVTALLGLNVWAVRLPFAISGAIGILGVMALVWQLAEDLLPRERRTLAAIIAGVWFVFSPPALHFSRLAFESGLSLTFLIWGMTSWLAFCRHRPKVWVPKLAYWRDEALFTLTTVGLLSASIYSYHSAKIVVPFLLVTTSLLWWKKLWAKRAMVAGIVAGFAAAVYPLVRDAVSGSGGERFTQASVFGLDGSLTEKLSTVALHFVNHFSLDFLIHGATLTYRHGDGRWGFLLLPAFIFALLGFGAGLLKMIRTSSSAHRWWQWWLLAVLWIVIGMIPAAIGRDVPHANRALLSLPGWLLLSLLGGIELTRFIQESRWSNYLIGSHGEKNLLVKWVMGVIILFSLLMGSAMMRDYFVRFPLLATNDFQDGYISAFRIARQAEPAVDKILFTSAYGQPYIYALFVRQTNPIWYQGGSLIKYEFSDRITIGDLGRTNTLIIGTPTELPLDRIPMELHPTVIKGADGSTRFVVVRVPATSASPTLLGEPNVTQ